MDVCGSDLDLMLNQFEDNLFAILITSIKKQTIATRMKNQIKKNFHHQSSFLNIIMIIHMLRGRVEFRPQQTWREIEQMVKQRAIPFMNHYLPQDSYL